MRWDEENRLKGVYDSEQRLSSYLYDAGGERTLKMSGSYQSTYINSSLTISSVNMTDYTLYTSPYMVMTDNEYTKHYYVEADRVASKIGGGMANNITDINDVVIGFDMQSENDYQSKTHEVDLMMRDDFDNLEVGVDVEVIISPEYWLGKALYQNNSEQKIYFFHKDHLGSSTQISDISANIIHHIEYMPFGETFVEQRSNWGTNYKFNGKELDEETGFYYYGARYYNPDISIWLSVDPLSDKYPSLSPYNYCANNPIKYVDPDGMRIDDYIVGEDGILKEIIKTDKPHRLFVEFDSGTKVELFFNDPENDRKQLETYAVGEKLVTHVSNEDVNCIMSESGIKNKKMISRWYTAASQSENQMDFGVRYLGANPTKDNTGGFVVFGSKNKAYNLLDGGNFLWGYAMNKLGFSLSSAKFGADANEKFKDSMGDQKAIQDGFIYTNPTKEKSDNYKYKGIKK